MMYKYLYNYKCSMNLKIYSDFKLGQASSLDQTLSQPKKNYQNWKIY